MRLWYNLPENTHTTSKHILEVEEHDEIRLYRNRLPV